MRGNGMKHTRLTGWQLGVGKLKVSPPIPTNFDLLLSRLGLTESEAARNETVRLWVRENSRTYFVPEKILKAIGVYSENSM